MYVNPNFKTKKALKFAIKNGMLVTVFQPGPFQDTCLNGRAAVEGPHYPEPHRWYASVEIEDGKVIKVK